MACLFSCSGLLAQQIALSTDVSFTLSNGKILLLKRGQLLKASGTRGYSWLVPYNSADTLAISGDDASELHRSFSDREMEQLYLEIAAELRGRRIIATNARVTTILNQELAQRDRDAAIEDLQVSIEKLELETRRLETALQNRAIR